MRETEAIELRWRDVDLDVGAVALDRNKTDDPRSWALDAGVVRALKRWKELRGKVADDDRVFVDGGLPIPQAHLAEALRKDLLEAGVKRKELHETTKERRRLRLHDLRATFVSISLANGATESWIADRTGHRSSQMINRYKRVARTVADLGLGRLAPMDAAIPELRPTLNTAFSAAARGAKRPGIPTRDKELQPFTTA